VTASETEVNFYRLLGVAYSATNREIARAYRNAMKATHPDRVAAGDRQAAEERAKLLNRAYRTLTRPADRLAYDRTLRQEVVQEQIMSSYFGGMGMPGTERDRYGDAVRYQQTARDMAERTQSERSAIVTVLLIFGGATALVVGLIVIWAVASGLVHAVL
jgi:DnaJ-class molecular chaperone